jgi:Rrf2 family protein
MRGALCAAMNFAQSKYVDKMKLVTKDIHCAVKSLLYFAKYPEKVITVNELVRKLNMRRAFSRRILQALSRHKILKSFQGRGGGFTLNVEPDKIRIMDVMDIFHEKTDIIDCLLEKGICPHPHKCLLMRELTQVETQLKDVLNRLTIEKLLKSVGN